jgi:hypothetical protein
MREFNAVVLGGGSPFHVFPPRDVKSISQQEVLESLLSQSVSCETSFSRIMILLFKARALRFGTRVSANTCLDTEEYRKTIEVDGELTWVRIISTLAVKLSPHPPMSKFTVGLKICLARIMSHSTFPALTIQI